MAIVLPDANGLYLRIDGMRVNLDPERRPKWNLAGQRIADEWLLPPDRPVTAQLYAYASVAAREAKDEPIWSRNVIWTLGALGYTEGAPDLWSLIYARLKADYLEAVDDLEKRFI